MNAYRVRLIEAPAAEPGPPGLACSIERVDASGAVAEGSLRVANDLGLAAPRYWLYVGQVAYRAQSLMLAHRDRVLLLGNDYTGARALCDIRMDGAAGAEALDALLAGSLALLPERAEDPRNPLSARTIVELPGVHVAGVSPFWQGFGARFCMTGLPDQDAPERQAVETAMASLLPRQPVVVSLLDPTAQAAIGEVDARHAGTALALARCGFRRALHINACDGGPVFEAQGARRTVTLRLVAGFPDATNERWLVLAPGRAEAWVMPGCRVHDGLAVSAAHAALLEATEGTVYQVARLHA